MTKKEMCAKLLDAYLRGNRNIVDYEVWYIGPITAAKVTLFRRTAKTVVDYGASKVSWPDEYSKDRGRDLAIRKAISKLAKEYHDKGLFGNNFIHVSIHAVPELKDLPF